MPFRYSPLNRGNSPPNSDPSSQPIPSPARSRRLRYFLLLSFPVILVLTTFSAVQTDNVPTFLEKYIPTQYRPSSIKASHRYRPGKLGNRLLSKHRTIIGSSSTEDWEILFAHPNEMVEEMFDLMAGRDESACDGWSVEKEGEEGIIMDVLNEKRGNWDVCWRKTLFEQSQAWTMRDSRIWPSFESRNLATLSRYQRCLTTHAANETLVNEYPKYSEERPFTPVNLTDIYSVVEGDERPCSLTATKVIFGAWWYLSLAFADYMQSPGEAVWLRNQFRALHELGYTILATNSYEGMVQGHREMPDVISMIWTEDFKTLTCQDDPRCLLFSQWQPTNEKYPGTGIDTERHVPDFWDAIEREENDPPEQRFAWLRHEAGEIGEEERGTIPEWKLFTTTVWGARPEDPYWQFTREEFPWNQLGQQFTLAPYDYPHHTYIPYSIERTCNTAEHVLPSEKENHLFILAKQTAYFYYDNAIPPEFWATLKEETGLNHVSVATGEHDMPDGLESLGRVSREEFEVLVAKSKLMLGIGRPLISPSVYSSLCQGTPVVVPYFREKAVPPGWDLYNGAYVQHGPAAAIGPPYVYSYKSGNMTDLVEKIKTAASTPIERYLPDDMTFAAEERNMDDLLRFNWQKHGELIRETESQNQSTDLRRRVIARCFKIGRCKPIDGELRRGEGH